jgi:hypothetical protein
MKRLPLVLLSLIFLSAVLNAQEMSREQKFDQINILTEQINKIVQDLLRPSTADIEAAGAAGLAVFRLMPRETYGRITSPQEGGAFYSFSTGSHDYQKIAQILLEGNFLSTGFAGANYGLMGDLGTRTLSEVNSETPEIDYLLKYKAPGNILDARVEQRKAHEHRTDTFTLKSRFPATIGNTFVLRSVSFGRADALVAFKIIRKEADGSLIIFWKPIADFGKPELDPNIREN